MPVFNRLTFTQSMLKCLRDQDVDELISVVVVNHGSTDGTSLYLNNQSDITVLEGDSSLWWAGAVDLALHYVFQISSEVDWILLVNNDTIIKNNYIQQLLDISRKHAPAAVGSVIRNIKPPHDLLSIGPRIDARQLIVSDIIEQHVKFTSDYFEVNALSGRGVLYPASVLRLVGGMRVNLLPHYLADYELALRVRSAGCRLLISTAAAVYSTDEYGNNYQAPTFLDRLFSRRSPAFLPAQLIFWWTASDHFQRLTLPFRSLLRIIMIFTKRTRS